MLIGSSVQNCVVFLGFEDPAAAGGIACIGTGFLVSYKGRGYMITARHVAEEVEDVPFVLRVNRHKENKSDLISCDQVRWHYHPDPSVDAAALSIELTIENGYRPLYLPEERLATTSLMEAKGIDVGDLCYTVGLFHFIAGHRKNLPFVFSGAIALLPPKGETIPVGNAKTGEVEQAEAYLVETRAIKGASGSPVFVRPSFSVRPLLDDKPELWVTGVETDIYVLGLLQSGWFLPPDAPLRGATRATVTDVVPIGLGVVVPAEKIVELLEIDDLKKDRQSKPPIRAAQKMALALPPATTPAKSNPTHREDFNRLLGAAVKPPKSSDQT